MQRLANLWLEQTAWQIHNLVCLQHTVSFTYEDLCDRNGDVLQKLYAFMPELAPLDASRNFQVHSTVGRKANPIMNMNEKAMIRLSTDDINSISSVLQKFPDILGYFGYSLIKP